MNGRIKLYKKFISFFLAVMMIWSMGFTGIKVSAATGLTISVNDSSNQSIDKYTNSGGTSSNNIFSNPVRLAANATAKISYDFTNATTAKYQFVKASNLTNVPQFPQDSTMTNINLPAPNSYDAYANDIGARGTISTMQYVYAGNPGSASSTAQLTRNVSFGTPLSSSMLVQNATVSNDIPNYTMSGSNAFLSKQTIYSDKTTSKTTKTSTYYVWNPFSNSYSRPTKNASWKAMKFWGYFSPSQSGYYNLGAYSDDGAYGYIMKDGQAQVFVNDWSIAAAFNRTDNKPIYLSANSYYPIYMEWYEGCPTQGAFTPVYQFSSTSSNSALSSSWANIPQNYFYSSKTTTPGTIPGAYFGDVSGIPFPTQDGIYYIATKFVSGEGTTSGLYGPFIIDKTPPTISNLSVVSNNSSSNKKAVAGNTLTINFTASEALQGNPQILINGYVANATYTNISGNNYTATVNIGNDASINSSGDKIINGPINVQIAHYSDLSGNLGSSVQDNSVTFSSSNLGITLELTKNPTTLTNGNVAVTAKATAFNSGNRITTMKYASGSQSVNYFTAGGTNLTITQLTSSNNSNGVLQSPAQSAFNVSTNGFYTVYATDNSGNVAVQTIDVENIYATPPVITEPTNGTITNNNKPTIKGTGEAGATVTVYDNGTSIGTALVQSDGTWSLTLITALSDGTHPITAKQQNATGNVSAASNTVNLTIDTTAPTLTLTQSTTSATNESVTITATAADNVAVASVTKPDNTVVTGSSTTYTVTTNGTYTFTATDTAGNVTTQSININNILISSTNETSVPNISASLVSAIPNPAKSSDEIDVKYAINTVPFSLASGKIDEAVVLVDMSQAMKSNQRFSEVQNGFVNQVINDSNLSSIKLGVVGYNNSVYIGTRSNYSDPKSCVMKQTDENLSNIDKTNFLPLYNLNDANTKDGYRQFYQNGYIYNNISSDDQRQFGGALKAADKVLTDYGNAGAKKAIIIVSSGNLTYSDAQINSIIGKGYKIIVLDISNSNTTNINDTYTKLCGNDFGINGNYYKGTFNDGVNYNSVDADMKNVDTSLKGVTGVTTLSINDAKLNIDLGENFKAIAGGGLEGSGKVCTVTIPQINFTYNVTTGLWVQSGTIEVTFKVKSESGKYGQLGFGLYTNTDNTTHTNNSTISYTNFYNIATNKIIETPTINIAVLSAPVITGPADGTITKNNKPTITGTSDANSIVNVYDGTALIGRVTADGSGQWTFTPITALLDGTHEITATATDGAGNVSSVSNTVNITIDTIKPIIALSQSPIDTILTHGNVTVTANVTDNVGVAVTKWASGNQAEVYFSIGGNDLSGNTFIVTENGTYTVYARDTAGNESVQTIVITNIRKLEADLTLKKELEGETPLVGEKFEIKYTITPNEIVAYPNDVNPQELVVSNLRFTEHLPDGLILDQTQIDENKLDVTLNGNTLSGNIIPTIRYTLDSTGTKYTAQAISFSIWVSSNSENTYNMSGQNSYINYLDVDKIVKKANFNDLQIIVSGYSNILNHGIFNGDITNIKEGSVTVTNSIPVTLAMIVDVKSTNPIVNLITDNTKISESTITFKKYEILNDGTIDKNNGQVLVSNVNGGNINLNGFTMESGREYIIMYTITPNSSVGSNIDINARVTGTDNLKNVRLTIKDLPDLY